MTIQVESLYSLIKGKKQYGNVLVLPTSFIEVSEPVYTPAELTDMWDMGMPSQQEYRRVAKDITGGRLYGFEVIVDPAIEAPVIMRKQDYKPSNPLPFDEGV